MIRNFALPVLIVIGVLATAVPRIAQATPGKDGCAMIPFDPQSPTIGIYGPHTWCLDRDIVVAQDDSVISLITVHGSDTTIDCRGHLLEYQGAADFSYAVVNADAAERITVRNCRFRGFSFAIALGDGDGNVIEDNLIHSSRAGYFGQSTAISAYGTAVVRRNRVFDSVARAMVVGAGSTVTDNLIDGVIDSAEDNYIIGIDVSGGGVEIARNTLRGLRHLQPGDPTLVQAIQLSQQEPGRRVDITDNVFANTGGAIEAAAVTCGFEAARIDDNVITGFSTATAGCTSIGDNDISP